MTILLLVSLHSRAQSTHSLRNAHVYKCKAADAIISVGLDKNHIKMYLLSIMKVRVKILMDYYESLLASAEFNWYPSLTNPINCSLPLL